MRAVFRYASQHRIRQASVLLPSQLSTVAKPQDQNYQSGRPFCGNHHQQSSYSFSLQSFLLHRDMERASAAGGAMVSLAAKLSTVLGPKYKLVAGVRTDILFLRSELQSMHAFLEKASMVQHPDAQVRCWMKEVRELAYDIEDSLDEFMHRVEANDPSTASVHGSSSFMVFAGRVKQLLSTGWTHLRLANEIKGLKARTIDVSERRSRYKLGEDIWMSTTHMSADPRISVLYADAPDLVGIERPDGIGSMTSLRALLGFDICRSSRNAVQELGNLKNLRELAINWTDPTFGNMKHQEAMLQTLGKLGTSNLRSFAVCSRNLGSLEFFDSWSPPPSRLQKFRLSAYYFFPRVPRWMTSLSNLIYLNINIAELTDEDIHILKELPSLLHLDLWLRSPQKEDGIVVHGAGFPYLKELYFSCEGTFLKFEEAALPKLERLQTTVHVIRAKPYNYQFGIEYLTSVKQIDIQAFCDGASVSDINDFEHAIVSAMKSHPSHPRINIQKRGMSLNFDAGNKRENNVQEENRGNKDVNHANKKRRIQEREEHNVSNV